MSRLRSIFKKVKSLSIQMKFVLVVTSITTIILFVNGLLFYNFNYMINQIDDVYDSNIGLNELTENLELVRSNMTVYLNTKSSQSMEDYYRYEQSLREKLEQLNRFASKDHVKMSEKNIRSLAETYLEYTGEAIEAKRGRNIEKYKNYYEESEQIYKYVTDYIFSLNNEQFKDNARIYKVLSGSLQFMELLCIIIFIIVAVIGTILVTIMCNTITIPLRNLVSAAKQVSEGDYEIEMVTENVGGDEVAVLSKAFLSMVESIQDNIVQLKRNMENEREMKEKELMMEAHLKDAQLRYLQAQINPHFLFNTLNAGAQLAMMEGADRTYDYVQQVAKFFRYNIKRNNDVVTLAEEIAMVDSYIYILNVRFSGEIGFEKQVDEKLLSAKVPGMSLQPIVENSVNYGIRDIERKGNILLSVYQQGDEICISIKDNGIGMTKERIEEVLSRKVKPKETETDSNGIGLVNVMSRYELLYGRSDVIDIISEGYDQGTEVRLYVPVQ